MRKQAGIKHTIFICFNYFTFFLQLVQYLKLIGTVPAIDINTYLGTVGENIDMDL